MEMSTFIYFLTASIILTVAPGPDNLYLLTKSLSDGAKSGVVLAAGLASGIIFHTFLVMVGVAAFVQNSPLAFAALKIFGAVYLIFLASKSIKAARAGKKISMQKSGAKISYAGIYRRGVLMNVLNPKVLLFFLAFLPQFVNFATSPSLQIIFLGVTFAVQAFLIFAAMAICAGKIRNLILRKKNLGQIFNYVEGFVLIFIALTLLIF